jgi:hypothetical protein
VTFRREPPDQINPYWHAAINRDDRLGEKYPDFQRDLSPSSPLYHSPRSGSFAPALAERRGLP